MSVIVKPIILFVEDRNEIPIEWCVRRIFKTQPIHDIHDQLGILLLWEEILMILACFRILDLNSVSVSFCRFLALLYKFLSLWGESEIQTEVAWPKKLAEQPILRIVVNKELKIIRNSSPYIYPRETITNTKIAVLMQMHYEINQIG